MTASNIGTVNRPVKVFAGSSNWSDSGWAVEVYGEVTIGNGYSGNGANPVLVKIDQPAGYEAPDGSMDNPYYIEQNAPLYVRSCENETSTLWASLCNPR